MEVPSDIANELQFARRQLGEIANRSPELSRFLTDLLPQHPGHGDIIDGLVAAADKSTVSQVKIQAIKALEEYNRSPWPSAQHSMAAVRDRIASILQELICDRGDVRNAAINAIAEFGTYSGHKFLGPLTVIMMDPGHSVHDRCLAIRQVTHCGIDAASAAVETLTGCLIEDNPEIQTSAAQALERLGPEARDAAYELSAIVYDAALSDFLNHQIARRSRRLSSLRNFRGRGPSAARCEKSFSKHTACKALRRSA